MKYSQKVYYNSESNSESHFDIKNESIYLHKFVD